MNVQRQNKFDNNKTNVQGNNLSSAVNCYDDGIIAQLTDMFGEIVASDVILNVCTNNNFELEKSIDHLIKCSEELQEQPDLSTKRIKSEPSPKVKEEINYHYTDGGGDFDDNNNNNDDNDDVLIESEEIILTQSNEIEAITTETEASKGDIFASKMELPYQGGGVIRKTTNPFQQPQQPNCEINSFQSQMTNFSFPPVNYAPHNLDKTISTINDGHKIMIIMRGAPGCGKSYLARAIIDRTMNRDYLNHIFSTDDFFYDKRGRYVHNTYKLEEAHSWNHSRVNDKARLGWSPIIVDNTNTKLWEMYPYFHIAVQNGYLVDIMEPQTPWSCSASKLASHNYHGVPKEKIARILAGYEISSVDSIFRQLGIMYTCAMPQIRANPIYSLYQLAPASNTPKPPTAHQIPETKEIFTPVWPNPWNPPAIEPKAIDVAPKPPRTKQSSSSKILSEQFTTNVWKSFEKEQTEFWALKQEDQQPQNLVVKNFDKSKKLTSTVVSSDLKPKLLSLLKNDSENSSTLNSNECDDDMEEEAEDSVQILEKHSRNCPNENKSFSQIRQIYPTLSIKYLWDLFEKCQGNGDWTMDILLNTCLETSENSLDDFTCECDREDVHSFRNDKKTVLIGPPPPPSLIQPNNHLSRREKAIVATTEEIENAKKLIQDAVQISDQHYSTHTKKIRDIRRGVEVVNGATAEAETLSNDGDGNEESSQLSDESDEFVEISLGADLVLQLDQIFGVVVMDRETVENTKTNVFMPKSLASQLYAIWMESLYNQLEDQRQRSIREDAEFARQLHAKQKYPALFRPESESAAPTNLKDIMEMELAWAAYKTEINEWKSMTPQDLASTMTRDKLFKLFPDVNQDMLIEVLAAHNYKFVETVEVLKATLHPVAISDEKIAIESKELLKQAQAEVETAMDDFQVVRSSKTPSDHSLDGKKLGSEEAKRVALKEFEDCRNLAMHHTQLKAECYIKAKDAIQRGDTSVAVYYSQIANLHKTKIDMFNHKAANCIMDVHNLTQNNPDMLDLHYLHVAEAAECLDIFLDKHISKLKVMPPPYKYIYVITGRGLHSSGGFSTIKQRVKLRLRERSLNWSEVNPGLLKIKIFTNSRLSDQL